MSTRYAMVETATGTVVNVILMNEPGDMEPPHGIDLVSCPADVEPKWIYDGEAFSPPAVPDPVSALTAYAANKRWETETGGITVAGVPVHTDDRSKLMILGARLEAMGNPATEKSWVGADGNVYALNAAAIIGISDAVAAHVTACFECFAGVRDAIIAGETTTREQIDAAFALITP